MDLFLLSTDPFVELSGHSVQVYLVSLGLSKHFPNVVVLTYILTSSVGGFQLSTSSPARWIVSRFHLSHPGACAAVPTVP